MKRPVCSPWRDCFAATLHVWASRRKFASFITSLITCYRAECVGLVTLTAAATSSEAWTDLSLGKGGAIGILDLQAQLGSAWVSHLTVVSWRERDAGVLRGDLHPNAKLRFTFAVKLIADLHLFNLELIRGNSWRESAVTYLIQNTYRWIFPWGGEVWDRSGCITPSVCSQ